MSIRQDTRLNQLISPEDSFAAEVRPVSPFERLTWRCLPREVRQVTECVLNERSSDGRPVSITGINRERDVIPIAPL